MSRLFTPPGENDFRLSLARAYDIWLANWATALSALANATRSRALSANEVAAHMKAIETERALVTKQFTLLLGRGLPHRSVDDDVSIAHAEAWH